MSFNSLQPCLRADKLENVNIDDLKSKGITHIWLDVDNTVSLWGEEYVSPQVCEWVKNAKEQSLEVYLVTNGNKSRVDNIADTLGIGFYKSAGKPNKRALSKILCSLNIKKENLAIIGDQLFTDILAANRLGAMGVLLCPMCKREWLATKIFNRSREKIVWKRIFDGEKYKEHWKNCL